MIGLLALAAATLAAAPASAHGTLPSGGFYDALLHPFLAWQHFLLLLGTGLLLGRRVRPARAPLLGVAAGLALGLALGATGASGSAASILAGAGLAGLALALAVPIPVPALALLAAAGGLAVGLDTDAPVPAAGAGIAAWFPYAGVVVGVFLIVLDAMALASAARRPSQTVAVRVSGSWIAATAVTVLALQFRLGGA